MQGPGVSLPNISARGPVLFRVVFLMSLIGAGCGGGGVSTTPETEADPLHELRFTIVHTSDEHSNLIPAPLVDYRPGEPGPALGGFARLASVVEAVRVRAAEQGEEVLLTSAGDFLSGTPFAWLLLEGEAPELTLMNELGYDVVTLGNHEFDFGPERLAAYLKRAGDSAGARPTAVLATNTRPPPVHPLADAGIVPTHVRELENGLRIGFIGLIGVGAARVAPAAEPITFAEPREAAQEAVAALQREGVDIVIAVTHSGLAEDRLLARDVEGIDLILGGHDHRILEEPEIVGRTVIVHPGEYLQQVVRLELAFDRNTRVLRVRNDDYGSPLLVPLDDGVPESEWMAARVAGYRSLLEQRFSELTAGMVTDLAQPVAYSSFPLPARPRTAEMPLGNFIADAMRQAAGPAVGTTVDIGLQASGQIRSHVQPGRVPHAEGAVTAYDLVTAVGLGAGPDGTPGYPVVSVWLTGEEVRRAMEVSILLTELMGTSYFLQVSGLEVRYDPARAVLARIPFKGTPIPTGRAVQSATLISGGAATPIERGDETLYHIVTDRYVASFLPLVGGLVPRLMIEPKDAGGQPITDLDQAIVRRDGAELKVWQAVVEHAMAQPAGASGLRWISDEYASPRNRLVVTPMVPLLLWPMIALVALILLLVLFFVRRRRARMQGAAATASR
jgi:5'-nucleotidase / UDP-sugar diphosphatase